MNVAAKSLKYRFIYNTLSTGFSTLVLSLLTIFMTPFLIFKIGTFQFGLLGIVRCFLINGSLGVFDFALQQRITKLLSDRAIDKKEFSTIISTGFYFLMIVGSIISYLIYISTPTLVVEYFEITKEFQDIMIFVIRLIGVSLIFQFPNLVLIASLEGVSRFDLSKGFDSLSQITYVISTVVFLTAGYPFEYIIYMMVASSFLNFILNFYFAHKKIEGMNIKISNFDSQVIISLLKESKYLFSAKVTGGLSNHLDRIMVATFLTPHSMAFFDVANRIGRIFKIVMGFCNSAIIPASSEISSQKNYKQLSDFFLRCLRFNVFLYSAPLVVSCLYINQIIELWVGDSFSQAIWACRFLLVWSLVSNLASLVGNFLTGLGKGLKNAALISLALGVLKVFLSFLLIEKYQVNGLAFSTLVSLSVVTPIHMHLSKKHILFQWSDVAKIMGLFLFSSTLWMISFLCLESFVQDKSLFVFVIKVTFLTIVYWFILFRFVLNQSDRDIFRDIFRLVQKKLMFNSYLTASKDLR